jgi:hypothetical protein
MEPASHSYELSATCAAVNRSKNLGYGGLIRGIAPLASSRLPEPWA